jgi:hypothetical protein
VEDWEASQVFLNITVALWVVAQSLVQLVDLQWAADQALAVGLEVNQCLL